MKAEPAELSRDLIARVLADRWNIRSEAMAYLAVGGGGHHWRVTGQDSSSWFITANGLVDRGHWLEPDADAMFRRTALAYETVRDLDFDFAVPAVSDRTGSLLYRIHPVWALSVYPYVETVKIIEEQAGPVVAGFIGQLHAAVPSADVPRWRSTVPQRQHIERAVTERDRASLWATGPYAEQTRALVVAHHHRLSALLDRYDRLVTASAEDPGRWVLTHGEPHVGNTVQTPNGEIRLIDWDTLAVAPRERDLWQLLIEADGKSWDAYRVAIDDRRIRPRPSYMELFPLWWRLADIGSYIRRLRGPHLGDADDAVTWCNLESSITAG